MRHGLYAGIVAGLLLVCGCGEARQPRTTAGDGRSHAGASEQLRSWVTGDAEQLAARGRIDERLSATSADGTRISAWIVRGQDGDAKGTAVLLHDLGGSKADLLPLAQRVSEAGYDALLVDLRAHGASGGQYVTYGVNEVQDVRAAVDAALSRGLVAGPFYVIGHGLGAATAIEYAAASPRSRGVIAVAPFSDLRSLARYHAATVDPEQVERTVNQAAAAAGFDPAAASPAIAATGLRVPLIVVHGKNDMTVPYSQGLLIAERAGGPRKLYAFEKAGHEDVLVGREDWYVQVLAELTRMAPAEPPAEPIAAPAVEQPQQPVAPSAIPAATPEAR